MTIARWFAPAALAAALGAGSLMPAPAQAQSNDLTRIIVDVADVIMRGGQPYYRHGAYGHDDRLVVGRDRYGRTVYYRTDGYAGDRYGNRYGDRYRATDPYRAGPPYGRAHGYYRNGPGQQRTQCDRNGRCTVRYYDPRQDQRRYRDRYSGYGYRGW